MNITEYGMLRDMGVPGQLVQWMSMFEDEKVDAQTAYWNYAGNLSDNSSRNNGANGGWWMFKWYGDLAGSTTVEGHSPAAQRARHAAGHRRDRPGEEEGHRAVRRRLERRRSRPSPASTARTFGTSVDVQVRADRLNGAGGRVAAASGDPLDPATVSNGTVALTVPNADRYAAYQVEITPALAARQPVATDLVSSVEAENTTLANATAYAQDPSREWSFMASNGRDVGSFNKAGSSATWNVTVPRTGNYRLRILAGANLAPGQHALFVDGAYKQLIKYSADLSWTYRGTTDVTVPLTAGNARALDPGERERADDPPRRRHHARSLRPVRRDRRARRRSIRLWMRDWPAAPHCPTRSQATARLACRSRAAASATFFATTAETGYYDVTTHFTTKEPRRPRCP